MIGYLQIFEFFFPRDRNENATVEVVLSEHIDLKMVGQSSDVDIPKNLINVRRNHVLEDGIAKMSRSRFDPTRPLSVKFADELGSSEGAIDLGGSTREFFSPSDCRSFFLERLCWDSFKQSYCY